MGITESGRMRRRLAGAGTITLTVDVPLSSEAMFIQAEDIEAALANESSWSADFTAAVSTKAAVNSIGEPVSTPHVLVTVSVEAAAAAAQTGLPTEEQLAASVSVSFPGQTADVSI